MWTEESDLKKVPTRFTTVHSSEHEAFSDRMRNGFFASIMSFLSFSKRFQPIVARISRFSSFVPCKNQNFALLLNKKAFRKGSIQSDFARRSRRSRSLSCS